jgi:hypothetical protein
LPYFSNAFEEPKLLRAGAAIVRFLSVIPARLQKFDLGKLRAPNPQMPLSIWQNMTLRKFLPRHATEFPKAVSASGMWIICGVFQGKSRYPTPTAGARNRLHAGCTDEAELLE